jgi:hypothetical protein
MTQTTEKTLPPARKPAIELETFLINLGFPVPCNDEDGNPPGDCTGCAHQDKHLGFCIVTWAKSNGEFIDDCLCLIGLPVYLAVVFESDGFEGASIEVIRP